MNVRNMCITLLVGAGLGLSLGFSKNAAADTELQSVQDRIRQEQIADFHRRSLESFPQQDISVAAAGFLDTGLADAVIERSNGRIRLQGRLAQWSIREEHLAGYRTGMLARTLIGQEAGVVATIAKTDDSPRFSQAKGLLKSARFEWPEFLPPALLR